MKIKTMPQKWGQALETFWDRLRRRQWQKIRHRPGLEAFQPQKKLDEGAQALPFQPAKARADHIEPQLRREDAPPLFGSVLKKSDAQLRQALRLCVQRSEDGASWEAVTEHCCLGGCDMGVYTFPTERDALLFAALLQAIGYHPPHNIACPACYAEYHKDCI